MSLFTPTSLFLVWENKSLGHSSKTLYILERSIIFLKGKKPVVHRENAVRGKWIHLRKQTCYERNIHILSFFSNKVICDIAAVEQNKNTLKDVIKHL